MCLSVLGNPILVTAQPDGRIRHWGLVTLPGEENARILRVVTLVDGKTVHNAFLDRSFRENDQ